MPVHPDYIATTAFDSRVLEAMMQHLTGHHDKPMIVYRHGRVSPSTGHASKMSNPSTRIPAR
jgi:cysteine sulfinate desulfinase/cysteine desulfurase-like protein